MPFADFTLVFSDAEIVDYFKVLRRADAVDQHGRSNPLVVGMYDATGIITIAGANDLQRLPEHEYQRKTISVTTPFQIKTPRPGVQPDVIRWKSQLTGGNYEDYVVVDLQDASNFGPGFVNVLAQRLDTNIPILTTQ